jgi:hypothetical protein
VWQGKDLQVPKNEILGRFADVWQGKELAVFGWYSQEMVQQKMSLVNS